MSVPPRRWRRSGPAAARARPCQPLMNCARACSAGARGRQTGQTEPKRGQTAECFAFLNSASRLPEATLRCLYRSRNSPVCNLTPESSRPAKRLRLGIVRSRHSPLENSSAVTPACLSTPDSVPTLSSRCSGTTQPTEPRLRITWLPFWRIRTNPSFSNARIASSPETPGKARRHGQALQRWSGTACRRTRQETPPDTVQWPLEDWPRPPRSTHPGTWCRSLD